MFCPKCGTNLPADAKYCIKCGSAIPELKNSSKDHEPQVKNTSVTKTIDRSEKNVGPEGVGGWLSLLIFMMVIFWPLMAVGRFYADITTIEKATPSFIHSGEWEMYKTFYGLLIGMCVVALIYAGISLRSDDGWVAVRRAILVLWMTGPVASIIVVIFGSTVLGLYTINSVLPYLMTSVVSPTIWTLYLLMSRRVRNTYGGKPVSISDDEW